jgi:hypothetical protein
MLKIAIIGSFKFHWECVGFICELFQNNKYLQEPNIEINIYFTEEYFGYVKYFQQIYKNINVITEFSIDDIVQNDIIIKLTANDPIIHHENIISILHVYPFQDKSERYITMSPFITPNGKTICFSSENKHFIKPGKINYIFPLYSGIINRTTEKIITYIGLFQPENIDADFNQFISNSPDYEFYFISHGVDIKQFGSNKNVKCFPDCNASDLVQLVCRSKFILHRHIQYSNLDRFSGALSIAVSHRKPLILNKYFSDVYNLPAITYDYEFCEVSEKINRMTYNEYMLELDKLDVFIAEQDDYNKNKIVSIINSNN